MPSKRSRSESDNGVEDSTASAVDASEPCDGGEDNPSSATRVLDENPDLTRRNRRMFGALMGHLGVAKRHLESESTQTLLQRQQQISAVVKQRNEEESRRVRRVQMENLRREKLLRRETAANLKISAMKKTTAAWKDMTLPLANFLVTNVEAEGSRAVNLLWLPALHNKKTKALLEQRRIQVRQCDHVTHRKNDDGYLGGKHGPRTGREREHILRDSVTGCSTRTRGRRCHWQ